MDGQRGDKNSCNTAGNRWNKKLILHEWQNIKYTVMHNWNEKREREAGGATVSDIPHPKKKLQG